MGDWPVLSHTKWGQDDLTFNPYTLTITPHASANTKSVYTQIVAAAPFDVAGLLFAVQTLAGASTQLVDIAIGAAASEQIIVPNALFAADPVGSNRALIHKFIPIFIRKGSRIAVRFQSAAAAAYFKMKVQLLAAGGFAGFQPPSKYEAWGAVTGTSGGTVATSGAANTKGAYAQLIAATALTSRWVILSVGRGSIDDVATDIAIGGAGSEQIIIPNIYSTSEGDIPGGLLLPWAVPKGTRIAARCAAGGASKTIQVHILGGV